jgi:hypothetical protein
VVPDVCTWIVIVLWLWLAHLAGSLSSGFFGVAFAAWGEMREQWQPSSDFLACCVIAGLTPGVAQLGPTAVHSVLD